MSVRTWKEEFFTGIVKASKTPLAAAEHSLRKWKGLDPEQLKKHKLVKVADEHYINSTKTCNGFDVGCNECALCRYSNAVAGYHSCDDCPLAEASGGVTCMDNASPYRVWLDTGDVKPMVEALKRTVEWLKKERKCS